MGLQSDLGASWGIKKFQDLSKPSGGLQEGLQTLNSAWSCQPSATSWAGACLWACVECFHPLFPLHPLKSNFSVSQGPQSSLSHLSSTQGIVPMTTAVLGVSTGESCPDFGVENGEQAREHCTEALGSRHSVLRLGFCRSVCLPSDKLLCDPEYPRLTCRSPNPLFVPGPNPRPITLTRSPFIPMSPLNPGKPSSP